MCSISLFIIRLQLMFNHQRAPVKWTWMNVRYLIFSDLPFCLFILIR
jgi:hypothetical protein